MIVVLCLAAALVVVTSGTVLSAVLRREGDRPRPWLFVLLSVAITGLLVRSSESSSAGSLAFATAIGILAVVWVALVIADVSSSTLPRELTVGLLILTPVVLGCSGIANDHWPWLRALGGAAVWFTLIGALWLFSRGKAMGFGDVILAPSLGFAAGWLGWSAAVVGFFAAFAVGAVVGVVISIVRRRGLRVAIPFGPFLVAGAAIGMAVGPALAVLYLRGAGSITG